MTSTTLVYYFGDQSKNIYSFLSTNYGINVVVNDYPEPGEFDTKLCKECSSYECKTCFNGFPRYVKIKTVENMDYILTMTAIEDFIENQSQSFSEMMIVKDTSVTNQTDSTLIDQVISDIPNDYDIFYLSKWLDKAEKYSVVKEYSGGMKMVKNFSPNGIQAIVLSRKGAISLYETYRFSKKPVLCRPFSQVINYLIENGEMASYSTTPLLFSYDTTNIVMNKSLLNESNDKNSRFSYLKSCEVQGSVSPEEPSNRRFTNDTLTFWIILLIIIISLTLIFSNKINLSKK